jgi:hypothetical protein
VLSETEERFFDALTEQTKPKPEPEVDIMATVLGPEIQRSSDHEMGSTNPFTGVPPDGPTSGPTFTTPAARPTELKINPPKPFSGKRDEFDRFIQDVILYLEINDEIYNTDKKKIAYTLSFMNEGDAASWKGQYLIEARTPQGLNLAGWTKFESDLTEAFKPYDAPGDALEKITSLRMGNTSIEDHIAKYKILITKAGISKTSPAAIDYFRRSLSIPLQKQLLNLPTPPTDLDGWFEWSSRLDNNFRKMLRIFGRSPNKKEEPKRHWHFQKKERDPNAMDVDAMTIEKRDEAMRKGLCFGCGKPGHLNRDCPDRKKTIYSRQTPPKKMNPKELYTHIRTLTKEMTEAEKDEFYKVADEEGF